MAESSVIQAPAERETGFRPVSPAAHLAEAFAAAEVTGPRAVQLRELPFQTMVGLRLTPGGPAVRRVESALGTALPRQCGQVAAGQGCSVLWLSPDEFLVLSSDQPDAETAVLVEALGDDPGSVIDLSANRTTLELSGPSARAVLEKGCALDLHPREFAAGTAFLTLIGSVPVILWKVEDETYRILPRSSFADFLGRWLLDGMAEFKAREIP